MPPGGSDPVDARNRIIAVVAAQAVPAPAAPLHLTACTSCASGGRRGRPVCQRDVDQKQRRQARDQGRDRQPQRHPAARARGRRGRGTPIVLIEVTSQSAMVDAGGRNVVTVAAYDDGTGQRRTSLRGARWPTTATPPGPLVRQARPVRAGGEDQRFRRPGLGRRPGPAARRDVVRGNRFTEKRGTSMATPMVAGVIAMMLEKNPSADVDDVRAALSTSPARRPKRNPAPADPGYAEAFGPGRWRRAGEPHRDAAVRGPEEWHVPTEEIAIARLAVWLARTLGATGRSPPSSTPTGSVYGCPRSSPRPFGPGCRDGAGRGGGLGRGRGRPRSTPRSLSGDEGELAAALIRARGRRAVRVLRRLRPRS